MTKLEFEWAARASSMTGTTREMAAAFTEAIRRAEEDAATDAEDILAQAEEANALDPVG